MKKSLRLGLVLALLLIPSTIIRIYAQEVFDAKCGDIMDGNLDSTGDWQGYTIAMKAGDQLNLSAAAAGDALKIGIAVADPANTAYVSYVRASTSPSLQTNNLAADGIYRIDVANISQTMVPQLEPPYSNGIHINGSGIGKYTLYIGCILSDGTVINAGDNLPETPAQPTTAADNSLQTTLPDFSVAQTKPFTPGTPIIGAISPNGSETFAYTLDAPSGSTLDLTLGKLTGNLNLTLVLLSSDNQVLFQINLVNLGELKTSLILPAAGTYTVGVYITNLQPPSAPEATAFQVQGTLSP